MNRNWFWNFRYKVSHLQLDCCVLPHPNPLPLGEGTTPGRLILDEASCRKDRFDVSADGQTRLPLPAGEGRGEGEGPVDQARSQKFQIPSVKILSALAVAVLLGTFVSRAQAGTITQKGSDTMVILAQKWAEVYMGRQSETKIQVTGGGSGTGFAALQNRATDLATASRPIKPTEVAACIKAFGARPLEYKVALDGLTVYVNEDNPLTELNLEQVAGIFTGKIRNWKEVGGKDARIVLFSRENSSGTYEFFKQNVLKDRDFAASAQTLPGTAQVLQAVANQKDGIGYGGAAYGAGAKHLKIKKTDSSPAIEPNEETVVNGTYPIWRFLYIYVNPALDKGEVAAYLNWIRSDDGQKVVHEIGYFPLQKHWRSK